MKIQNQGTSEKHAGLTIVLLAALLMLLFWRSFLPDYVHFSNDGPLGQQNTACLQVPGGFTGIWNDLTSSGFSGGSFTTSISLALHWLLGPTGYAKFLTPIALFILGLGAWTFFRQLKLTLLAATLGALAAMLNSTFFSDACWGTASHQIAFGLDFFALALVVSNTVETPARIRWARLALAGLCVGMNVIEAADIGALCSLFIAAFVFFKALMDDGAVLQNAVRGVVRVAVIAVFAGFIALQTITSLVGISIQGVAGTAQDTETKAQHWDFATQWSLPKVETLGLAVPGLFGYKMDTPKDMMPSLQDAYRNGAYWGGVGRDPAIDRFFDRGGEGTQPPGGMRFTGSGNYCGILVLLIALWTVLQSFRRKDSLFPDAQKRMIWFWACVALLSLPLAWGRFAPFSKTSDSMMFYALLYKLPYFSTIRNPLKFFIFLSWAVVVLFGYGVHALNRRHLDHTALPAAGLVTQLKIWWAKAGNFDRKWTYALAGLFGASVLAWLIYSAQSPELVQYLQKVGFSNENPAADNSAASIAAFSIGQLGWFLFFLAGAVALLLLLLAGYFAGPRAKIGAVLLGAFLILDLGRANLPFIVHWDYKQKYEVGSLNPVVDFLAQKPYEHRVAYGVPFPLSTPAQFEWFDQLYKIEWMQHHFPYYNVQSLDLVQMARMPEDLKAFDQTLQIQLRRVPTGGYEIVPETFPLAARRWQLTNTRYLLAPAGFLDLMNQQLDPVQHRFHILRRFEVMAKPGITQPTRLEELTAVLNENGQYALFEFTGALPRVKLYDNWQVSTNDPANLKTLADLNFDPAQTVLISTPQKNLPAMATNENTGTVEFTRYSPTHIVFTAHAAAPAVLLLNDKYDANWRVTVDGRPAELLRCNFLMRGVYLPTAGTHTVTFDFRLPLKPFYVTLTALGTGLLLCGYLFLATRRQRPV
jgi:hypothetical protein